MIPFAILMAAWGLAAAQTPQSPRPGADAPSEAGRTAPIYQYQITVVSRTIPAVNYARHRGSSRIDFRGTGLLPGASGDARVDSRTGATRIRAEFDGLEPATRFGPEYLTYVLWAITPQGRAENLGELVPEDDGEFGFETTTPLQSFGMIVTAEPYFAVTQPSDVVVMENAVREDTSGTVEAVTASYHLLQRGVYVADRARFEPVRIDRGGPLQLAQAENAVQIARLAGAGRYAAGTLARAERDLAQAQRYMGMSSRNDRAVQSVARAATQTAEDARAIAVRRIEAERLAAERSAAEQARRDAARRADEADAARADSARAEQALAAAERARGEAERLARQAQADRADAEAEAAHARADAEAARAEREQMRRRLVRQLGAILDTRETAHGIIVSIGDVLFDFDRATLRPAARERLAKAAGVLLAYPGLNLRLEGHTDSVGTEPYNLKLSQDRAAAVRDYLAQQGVSPESVTAAGYGQTRPIASNDTAQGRQQNRRVELVVTGDIIGIPEAAEPLPGPPEPAPPL